MTVKLQWATPDADKQIMYMARVSNPEGQNSEKTRLLSYCMEEGHVSPFEMASVCLEINTTRDIGRQILRHRSFSFQEFCVAGGTKITLEMPGSKKRSAYTRTIEHLYKLQQRGLKMPSAVRVFDEASKTFVQAPIKEVFKTGTKPVFRVTLANGRSVDCTKEHKFLTDVGFLALAEAVGLVQRGSTWAMSKPAAMFACNGIPAYQNFDALHAAKRAALSDGTGLAGICEKLSAKTDVVRKWLKRHDLSFTKKEVASYTPIWNKGLSGYSLPKHSLETIQKMRGSAKRGAASNLWGGGADRSERLKIADWCATIRAEKLCAANYKCPCGSSVKLELHHTKTVASNPELAYDFDNIEVLCRACHRQHHALNGDIKSWREKSKGNTLSIHWSAVESVVFLGEQETYDMEVDHTSHNYVANGIVTHNSQRYADASLLGGMVPREVRLQDEKNRQNSIETESAETRSAWALIQEEVWEIAAWNYKQALKRGVAKEVARALLPEGLTPSRLYMNGTVRSWVHYLKSRLDPSTQKEHRVLAQQALVILRGVAPITMAAFFPEEQA